MFLQVSIFPRPHQGYGHAGLPCRSRRCGTGALTHAPAGLNREVDQCKSAGKNLLTDQNACQYCEFQQTREEHMQKHSGEVNKYHTRDLIGGLKIPDDVVAVWGEGHQELRDTDLVEDVFHIVTRLHTSIRPGQNYPPTGPAWFLVITIIFVGIGAVMNVKCNHHFTLTPVNPKIGMGVTDTSTFDHLFESITNVFTIH